MIPFPFQVAQFGMALPASAGGGGSVSYVGGQVSSRAGSTTTPTITFSLSGGLASTPAADDLVVITCVVGSNGMNPAQGVSGYTAIGQLNVSSLVFDVSLNVSFKRMGGTPDTTFVLPSTGSNNNAQGYTVQVFRGVGPGADIAALAVAASGSATGRPDPASVTPTAAGSVVAICGGGAATSGVAYTAPADFSTNFLTAAANDVTAAMVGSGYWSGWTSGAVDPAQYGSGSALSNDSWACYTLVLPPA